jgi:lambda family phage portal protein
MDKESIITRASDALVGFFSPRHALSRIAYRRGIRTLKAASTDRNTKSWKKNEAAPQDGFRTGGKTARQRAIFLAENHDAINGAITTITDHIVGTGINTDVEIQYSPNSRPGDTTAAATRDRLNQSVEDTKKRWLERAYDIGPMRLDPQEAETLRLRTLIIQGECFVHRIYTPDDTDRTVPLAYEVLDPSQLDGGYTASPVGRNIVEHGVEYDAFTNRIVAYHVTKGDYNLKTIRVPAADMIHTYRPDRPGQQRGITWLAPAIPRAYELEDIIEYAIIARKVQSAIALVVADNPNNLGPGAPIPGSVIPSDGATDVYTDPAGNKLRGINPGMIHHVGTGQVTSHTPAAPQDLDELTRIILRSIAIGMGISYEWLSGDYRQANFASLRLSENKTWKRIYTMHHFVTSKMKAPEHRDFIDLATAFRLIPPIPRRQDPYACSFSQPKRDWGANPLQEVNAITTAMGAGLTSLQEEAGKRGIDWRQLLRRINESREFAMMINPDLTLYDDLFTAAQTPPE